MFEKTLWQHVPEWWVVHPDRVAAKVAEWEQGHGPFVSLHRARQFTGDSVFALTITDPDTPAENKKTAAFVNWHTMEYGACAAIVNVGEMLLTGRDLHGNEAPFDAREFCRRFVITLIPDANPQGKLRLPFAITDGSQLDNTDEETVARLYFGTCNGKPFRRCERWRMPEEHVEVAGAIYEKISADEYVIPDMDERSTAMRILYTLGLGQPYDMAGLMHQAEFMNMEENAYCATSIEPWIPVEIQATQERWAQAVIEHWRHVGGRPVEAVDHHHWGPDSWVIDPVTGCVRKMANDYLTLRFGCPCLTIETQMNDPRTSPQEQMRLGTEAIIASLEFLKKLG